MNFILSMFSTKKCTQTKLIKNCKTDPDENIKIDKSLLGSHFSDRPSYYSNGDQKPTTSICIDQCTKDRDEKAMVSDDGFIGADKLEPQIDVPRIPGDDIDAMLNSFTKNNDQTFVEEHACNIDAADTALEKYGQPTKSYSIQENNLGKAIKENNTQIPEFMNNLLTKCITDSLTLLNDSELVCLHETTDTQMLECEPIPFLKTEINLDENVQLANGNTNKDIYMNLEPVPIKKDNTTENESELNAYDMYATKLLEDITTEEEASMMDVEFLEDKFLENLHIFENSMDQNNTVTNEAIETISISSSSQGHSFDGNIEAAANFKNNKNEPLVLDSISISSDENPAITIDESDSDDYHSSDFEFITESDAELDSLLINFTSTKGSATIQASPTVNPVAMAKEVIPAVTLNSGTPNLPGPSHDSLYITYSSQLNRQNLRLDESYKAKHRIPEGYEYVNLFQGLYNPRVARDWQNKAIDYRNPHSDAMLVEFEGIGFNMQVLSARNKTLCEVDQDVKEDAEATIKKILAMYPDANKKRRRL